ncbi:hypothetical protein GQ457_06G004080 [Hibiscus cannabinus]
MKSLYRKAEIRCGTEISLENIAFPLSEQMFFGVFGAANFNRAGCGGALRLEGGYIRALFSGPVSNYGADFATLIAVKVALEVLLEAKWSEDAGLVLELESQVASCLGNGGITLKNLIN